MASAVCARDMVISDRGVHNCCHHKMAMAGRKKAWLVLQTFPGASCRC